MLPHLNQSRPGAHSRSHHEHYTGSCPLSCPARRAPLHVAQHYSAPPGTIGGGPPFRPNHPHFDPSKLHPAFSGLLFQQRRTYTSQQQQPPLPPSGISGLVDTRSYGVSPVLNHAASGGPTSAGCGGGRGCGDEPTLDPAKVSPIFFGYTCKPDRPKM